MFRALQTAVREDKVGHAYLLHGPRGSGKTSTARVLAKALNCTDLGDDGEPLLRVRVLPVDPGGPLVRSSRARCRLQQQG